jgi:hypothetical protein
MELYDWKDLDEAAMDVRTAVAVTTKEFMEKTD